VVLSGSDSGSGSVSLFFRLTVFLVRLVVKEAARKAATIPPDVAAEKLTSTAKRGRC
jgi:hypothetical protein